MYTLTANTGKITRLLAIFLHQKMSIEHHIFLRVHRSFSKWVNAVFVGGFSGVRVDG